MTDNARIVRDPAEDLRQLVQEATGNVPSWTLTRGIRALTTLETELATAQAELARAREALRATPCAPHDGLDGFICLRCAALAPEQKGAVQA